MPNNSTPENQLADQQAHQQHDLQLAFDALAENPALTQLVAERWLQLIGPDAPSRNLWLTAKALSLSAQKLSEAAVEIYRELEVLEPQLPEHHANLGNALMELSLYQPARLSLLQALQLGSTDANVHFALSRIALELGEPLEAKTQILRALRGGLDQDIEVALLYLKCLIALDEIELAKDNAERLMSAPMQPELAVEFAFLLLQLTDYQGSENAALRVPKTAPEYPLALIGLALSFERSNKLEQARKIRQELAELNADFALLAEPETLVQSTAGQSLMQLDARLALRDKNAARASELLSPLLKQAKLDANLRIALSFELARALEEIGEVEQAFELLQQAHEARFAQVAAAHPKMAYEDDPLMLLNQVVPAFSAPQVDDDYADPVFVVGFPRSGTTLLEQLLDAHTELQSFDEQPFLQKCILQMQDFGLRYPRDLAALSAMQIAQLRALYFSLCRNVFGAPVSARYVDKNPLNLSRLPMIQALFPNAQVIVVLRNPADCVLSCYTQHFRAPAFAVAMRTLRDTAEMYARVFDFYTQIKPGLSIAIHELRYENLVTATEETARGLFAFLQLDWTEQLLQFTDRAKSKTISTPSYAAVTERVNTKAVNRADKFAAQFVATGASDLLAPWREYFGY
jgi:tetratricopeptide (TPR) repeat protein